MSHTHDHIERANVFIQEDLQITVREVPEMLDIRQTATYSYNSQRRWEPLPANNCSLASRHCSPHVAATTIETIRNVKFEFLPRYLTVPTPHTATFMQEALHGRQFGSDEEVKETVHTWIIREQPLLESESLWTVTRSLWNWIETMLKK